jgi:L-ascorbate metabolism protein UlaG (beta-lactamase superfamily)
MPKSRVRDGDTATRVQASNTHARRPRRRCAELPAELRPDPTSWPVEGLTAAWLGHATVLLRLGGTMILIDPALRRRIGVGLGLATLGPRRLSAPGLSARQLPPIDLLLVSHAHMDHLDKGTLRLLPRTTPVVTHLHLRDLLRRFERVEELGWGEQSTAAGVRVEALPSRHWGARMITDRHRGYGGFLLEAAGRRVVYTGDTAYTEQFAALKDRGPIDLAILPIGAYDPWIDNHASPEQAWAMGRQMAARHVLPVHHGTFRLSREPMDEPIRRLLAAAGDERWRVVVTQVGETWHQGP